ncbi:flagellar FlbD family protein [Ferroacidibacillus organovorans]|uniref:Flagellar protein D n=1 Tax=Ferroacidibacillus organovorans TaxID=1765683 RepID=A0A1V4ERZ9_9BACL|nr:flagellar FlbD family protein [Ferroacidibacillus organovorans]OPG15671.1 hypothetical protein B2M26_11495 [Ferroacidibacillus organovorans]
MIALTRMDGSHLIISALMIETIESTPDTVISLTSGRKYVVKELASDVVHRVTVYLQEIGLVGAHAANRHEVSHER